MIKDNLIFNFKYLIFNLFNNINYYF